MDKDNLIKLLYDEVTQSESTSVEYKEFTGEATKKLYERIIDPLYKRNTETASGRGTAKDRSDAFVYRKPAKNACAVSKIRSGKSLF